MRRQLVSIVLALASFAFGPASGDADPPSLTVFAAADLTFAFNEIAPRFADRAGGYTRVVKLGARHGDAAALSVVELVERAGAKTEKAAPKKPPRRRAPEQGRAQRRAVPSLPEAPSARWRGRV